MTALRIALLTYRGNPVVGGQGVYVRHLSKELVDLGHEVKVISGPPYPELTPPVPLVKLPSLDIWQEPFPSNKPRIRDWKDFTDFVEHASFATGNFSEPLAFSLRAWRYLRHRKGEFDLIHDNQTLGWGLLLLQRVGWPILETIHHPITVDRKLEIKHARTFIESVGKRRWYAFTKMQRRVARRLPKLVTVSESSKNDIVADFGLASERVGVVPVGVNSEMFRPLAGAKRSEGHLVTTASGNSASKGLTYLLEAVAKLATERPMKLTIIGQDRPNSLASDAIARLGLADRVEFASNVSEARIVELYGEAELAVVPSLYEGFSLPAIEAMSCGVPLVATTGGALREVAGTHGETCFLVEPGNSEALAATIRFALDDPTLRAKVAAQGRKRAKELWSWRRTAELTAEHYRGMLANRC